MSSALITAQRELADARSQLAEVLGLLELDPENKEIKTLKAEYEDMIQKCEAIVNAEKQKAGLDQGPESSAKAHKVQYKVNDVVSVRWKGSASFYEAKIISITGSAANPIYTVRYVGYSETKGGLKHHELRPSAIEAKKRKAAAADEAAESEAPAAASGTGVISAAASINPDLANQVRKEPSKVSDGPTRPPKIAKKIKANQELEGAKNKWQAFSSKTKKGPGAKKDSMFRTGEGISARVGFTGSGNAMRKDPERSRHTYNVDEEE